MSTRGKLSAFTLVELMVAIVISSILIAITVSTYTLFRRSVTEDQSKASLSQNARVAMDRITREIRLTPDLVTNFPASSSDQTVTEPHQVEFEDGYLATTDPNYLTYHRYYLNSTTLELDIIQYYFAAQPTVRVPWNSVDANNNPPVAQVMSTQAIAQGVTSFTLYGRKPLQITMTTGDNFGQSYVLETDVTGRNL